MPNRITVVISSTARDLPKHRKEVKDACLRLGIFPKMMEHLPALDSDAIQASLRMVDEADVYVGLFANRYGYVPAGHSISITEMEYNRAVERGMPRLLFLMDENHPISASDVETSPEALNRLRTLKERLKTDRVVQFFKSPSDLRAHVIQSLASWRTPEGPTSHYRDVIPHPPERYIAHPYTLLQTTALIGRRAELNRLSAWVTQSDPVLSSSRILSVVAIGGTGKSALAWTWFNEIAPQLVKPLAGRMWWSFYESGASFETFVIRSLAYVTARSLQDVQSMPISEREDTLIAALNRAPFLLVLDGLERIMNAYTAIDASHLTDDALDQHNALLIRGTDAATTTMRGEMVRPHRLRKTADPRAGAFLQKLSSMQASRILVNTRLYPSDLETTTGDPMPGSALLTLAGLCDEDAIELWRTYGVSGSGEELLSLFRQFDKHPLLIQSLAGTVAYDRHAPGDFDSWRQHHPDFDPFSLPLVQVKSHVLHYALSGLDAKAREILNVIAAFRLPVQYDILATLLVGEEKRFIDEQTLDAALTELEERGLVGWDRQANRYDLHPIIRGVAWSRLNSQGKKALYEELRQCFESRPMPQPNDVGSLDDLALPIDLFNTLIGLEYYDNAYSLFKRYLDHATQFRLSASSQRIELLRMLFPDGLDRLPRLDTPLAQATVLAALAHSLRFSALPGRAVDLYRRHAALVERQGAEGSQYGIMTAAQVTQTLRSLPPGSARMEWLSQTVAYDAFHEAGLAVSLVNLADALRVSGSLWASEAAARRAISLNRDRQVQMNWLRSMVLFGPGDEEYHLHEYAGLLMLGRVLVLRGRTDEARMCAHWVQRIPKTADKAQNDSVMYSFLADQEQSLDQSEAAYKWATRAWEAAQEAQTERDAITAARAQGIALLNLDNLQSASERLHHALLRARNVSFVEEEVAALIGLAEMERRQRRFDDARALLADVWEATDLGPFRLLHADARNVMAQIERDTGNVTEAMLEALTAFRLAWCDGPPFGYYKALTLARTHLAALGAAEPDDVVPWDESAHEPMVAIDIEPLDRPFKWQ